MDRHENGAPEVPVVFGTGEREPIAIVGIGCRFPGGGNDPGSFWDLLAGGADAIREVPPDRWNLRAFHDPEPGRPGKSHARWGGFIDGIDQFDPQFFGISPREAARMDPQQRLLLEVAWEALEDAGLPLERLAGSCASVFVGISSWDYSVLQTNFRDRGVIDVYTNTGGSLSIAANRISYCFDFRGPSAALDTACSSALVAVHEACRSIWQDGCPLALAGGANALLLPDWYVGFCRLGMLSPDGRCKAFSAAANGFVRSEGAGLVLLEPLSRALRNGHRIYAVIRGTAVNQDGRTPGMTVPRQEAQEALLRQACRDAGIAPADVQYVEAHGTGTLVGDPIEARALGRVLSAGRPVDRPCLVGSVKTNIGHLEAGSGIAGLIKTALALHHRQVPANLHFHEPNPDIDFESLRLRVPVRCERWPTSDGLALAGVNSFGFGGTNAHVVLQAHVADDKVTRWQGDRVTKTGNSSPSLPPEPASAANGLHKAGWPGVSSPCHPVTRSPCHLVTLSACTPEALRAAAGRMREFVAACPADVSLEEIAANAALRRTHHEHRLAVVAHSRNELAEQLATFAQGQALAGGVSGRALAGQRPRLGFVCAGQGPQWWAMGRQLLQQEPIFRATIERCDAAVRRLGSWSLLNELAADEAHSRMHETAISQPAIFALQVGLAELWRTWGVRPEALVGHSVGEVAAAYLAGVFELEDAVRVIYHRGRCMERASARGRMLALGIAVEEARELLAGHGEHVSLAAINSPTSVTLSGEPAALEEIARIVEGRGAFCRFLQVQYAFHSAQMDPVRDELLAALEGLRPGRAALPLFSTVTGQRVQGPEMGPEYWWHNVRRTVRFADGVAHLIETGCDAVLELSPHPVLAAAVAECYQQHHKKVSVLPSLRRKEEERFTLLRSLGTLHVLGYPIDWHGLLPGPHRFVRLPGYPWQHERFWKESDESRVTRLTPPAHPLLGQRAISPKPAWESRLDLKLSPYLADHRVQRAIIFPATGYLELAFAAAREAFGPVPCEVEDVKLANPLFLLTENAHRLHTAFDPDTGTVGVHTRPADGSDEWTAHFTATVRARQVLSTAEGFAPEDVAQRCPQEFSRAECVPHLQHIGLDYGPLFQGITQARQGEREALGLVELPDALAPEADEFLFHPALLDACFQVGVVADRDFDRSDGGLYLPSAIDRVRLCRKPGRRVWAHARLREKTERWSVADLDVYDEAGQLVAEVRGLRSQRVAGGRGAEALDDLLYAYQWQPQPRPTPATPAEPGSWLLFADTGGVAEQLAERLRAHGESCILVRRGPGFVACSEGCYQIAPERPEDAVRLIEAVTGDGLPACRGIVHLWNLDAPPVDGLSAACLESAADVGLLSVVHLLQAWDRAAGDRTARLFLVSRGAQTVGGEPLAVAQAPLIGLGRVVAGEYPRLRCRLVDLDPREEADVTPLFEELWTEDDEDEVALRGSERLVHRYLPAPGPGAGWGREQASVPCRLVIRQPGTLDGLTLQQLQRRPPGPGEVEIEVRAAGLNFSDVMKVLGLYPGLAPGPVPLGAECAGRITAIGAGVEGLHVGDEVLAVAGFSFGSHVVTRAELVYHKPERLTFAEAATLPIALLTANYALEYLGRLTAGERVLIHSAAGGVGLAAVQLVRRAGGEVFATAGTPEKREYLHSLGIEHVMDSRSLAFADEVLERTNGRGVDMVLNSLPGEAIARGLACLADYGRFLEIGKRDIYANSRLGMKPFRNNLSFFAIDLDRVMRERPALLGDLLRRLIQRVREGEIEPLPHRTWPLDDAVAAFRQLQSGKHIGKIVLTCEERPVAVAPAEDEPLKFRSDATYLVTGGLGGFGLAVARWLVERGARHLVLVGRRGAHTPEAREAVAALEALGARVIVAAADVASEHDLAGVLVDIDRTGPPLRGVLHAAMVLEDALLLNLDRDLLQRVLAPKVSGAWNLHRLTAERPLDFFVLFSSLSSVFGHAGQGNYAAANAFLDALAWHRHARGLPALTVNWGYLGEVGYLARRAALGERLERQGVLSFTVRQALTLLERAMQRKHVQVSVMRVEWSRWRGLGATAQVSPRFRHLCQSASPAGDSAPVRATREAVLAAGAEERRGLLESLLRDKVARILGTAAERLDAEKSLLNLGLDSLMAVELRNWIEGEFRVNLPIMELMRSPSLARLTESLLEQLAKGDGHLTPAPAETNGQTMLDARPEELLANVENLSGEEVDALLASLLAEKEHAPQG
jgi:acyl transferase domain-containing protein/acyl carrier protein